MSVFFIAVAFVLGFLPGIFEPFSGDAGADMLVADRTAARLSEATLGSAATPGVLNDSCTVEFFDVDDDRPVDNCAFGSDVTDPGRAVGIGAATQLNVTIEDGGALATVDGQQLRVGPTPPGTVNVVRAQRVVLVDGDEHRLVVRVW